MNRLLIFEQDPSEAVRLSQYLQRAGYAVASVTTGRQAAGFIRDYDFEIFLVNLVDPQEAMMSAIPELRRHTEAAQVRVLAMVSDPDSIRVAEALGADGMVTVPFENSDLLRKITELLENSCAAVTFIADSMENEEGSDASLRDDGASFKSITEVIVSEVACLSRHLPELGDQGPLALENMEEAVGSLGRRLDADTVIPGKNVPASVYNRQERHDFRNLLAAINGFSEILLLEDGLPENVKTRLQRIKKASRQFCTLLDNVKESAA